MRNVGKKAKFTANQIELAKSYIKNLDLSTKEAAGIVVLMFNNLKLTGEQIALILGVSASAIDRLMKKFRRGELKDKTEKNLGGGRNHFLLTLQEEAEILKPFFENAKKGELVGIDELKQAFEVKLGCEVTQDYMYKMLKRNKWRKVVPDKEHPKNDPEKAEEFKKKLFPRRFAWLPLSL